MLRSNSSARFTPARCKSERSSHAANAEDFLDLLTPQRGGPLWRNRVDQSSWIFRGQEDADWKLVPSALRGGDPWHKFRHAQLTVIPRTDAQEIIDAEESFVLDFANHASALGYEIPFDSAVLRDKDRQRERNDANHFPLADYRGIWALAQHYGVPTRLTEIGRSHGLSAVKVGRLLDAHGLREIVDVQVPSDEPHGHDVISLRLERGVRDGFAVHDPFDGRVYWIVAKVLPLLVATGPR